MEPRTLPEYLERAAATTHGFHHLDEAGGEQFRSHAGLLKEALRVGGGLVEHGLRKGETVAIIIPDTDGFLQAFCGITVSGCIAVPLYPPFSLAQLEPYLANAGHILNTARTVAVLTSRRVRRLLGTLHARVPVLRHILAIEDLEGPPLPAIAPSRPADPVFIQFTSGSTTKPRGAVITHENLRANIEGIAGSAGLDVHAEQDFGVSWLPLYHDMGLIGQTLTPICGAGSSLLMSPLLFLKRPVEWFRAISRHRGTISAAPNFAYAYCARRIRDTELAGLDLSSWRAAMCGAEPIHAATLRAFADRFAAIGFRAEALLPCYGLAEHTLAVTLGQRNRPLPVQTVDGTLLAARGEARICPPDAPGVLELVSCGRPLPGHRLRIVDEGGRDLSEGQVGEIVVSGPSVMAGYFGQEETEVLRDGWLFTGDLGYLSGGELYVCGRKKDLIIRHGRKYHPQDLEWIASEVPGVRRGNIVAFGVPGPRSEERIIVVAEARAGASRDAVERGIRERIEQGLSIHLDEVSVVRPGAIPKTTSGKLQRRRARERWLAGGLRDGSPPPNGTRPVVTLAASQWGFLKAAVKRTANRLLGHG